jgi:hypothetical protein
MKLFIHGVCDKSYNLIHKFSPEDEKALDNVISIHPWSSIHSIVIIHVNSYLEFHDVSLLNLRSTSHTPVLNNSGYHMFSVRENILKHSLSLSLLYLSNNPLSTQLM